MNDTQTLTLDVDSLEVGDRLESLYVYFREGIKIHEGLHFNQEPFGRVLVYVGADRIPVAMQFVDGPSISEACNEALTGPQKTRTKDQVVSAFMQLFGIASKMVAFHEARSQKLGNELIEDALKTAKRLPPKHGLAGCGAA